MFRQSVFTHLRPSLYTALALFAINTSAHATINEAAAKLEQGKVVERQLAGDDVHSYQLDLVPNQYVELELEQRGIDVAIWVYDPKGEKMFETDSSRSGEPESVLFLTEMTGPYRLEIRSSLPKSPEGRYDIKIKKLHAATDQDKYSVTARRLVADAIQLERQAKPGSFRKAIEKHQQSIPIWRLAGSRVWEANVLYLIANDYGLLGEKQKALEFAAQAVTIAHAAARDANKEDQQNAVKVEAYAFDISGRIHNQLGDKKKALEYFDQALPLHKSIGNRPGELYTINGMAKAHQYMGDFEKALSLSEQAITIAKEIGDHAEEAMINNNMCVIHEDLGDYKLAREYCDRALTVRHNSKDSFGEAITLGNLGSVNASFGDYQQALDFYHRAAALQKSLGNQSGQAIQFNNIGWVYATLGDYEKGINFYNKALEIFTAQDDQYRAGNVLNNLAATYMRLGDYPRALEIGLKVLPMRRAVNNNNGAAVTLRHIANAYAHLDQKQKALDCYNQAIEILRSKDPRQLTAALRDLGSLYSELGERQKAIDTFNEALQITRNTRDRIGEADTLARFAKVVSDSGNLTEAKRMTEAALASVESLRVNLKSQQLRAAYFASVRKYHELYVNVLMQLHRQRPSEGFDAMALQASENARARSLLELLMEANAQIRQGVDPALVDRERKVRQDLSVKAEQQMRLLSAKHTEQEATSISQKLDALANEYEEIQTRIRQTSPRYAAVTQPAPLSLKEIQSQLLDENTVLLEYSLGEEKSYLWAISPASLRTFELPKRAEVEQAARRVYDLVTASDANRPNEPLEQRRKRLAEADESYPNAIAALSQMLLGPVAAELKNKRLIVVAEGVLQYVPFAALSEPGESETPLMVKHEIVMLPSGSVLGVLRRETKERSPAPKGIAVFADPVFEVGDARLTGKTPQAAPVELAAEPEVKRSAEESGLVSFQRLRFSREEANQIMKFAERNNSLQALDFSANRTNATSHDLENYGIVHFATHGIINSRNAELSGIVLSLVDQNGKPQNGFLRLYDIYNMNLKADLVVLSACQTALGKEIEGEGLIGLTRAFMYAGAPRVVASLWRADDRATAVLMSRFYEGLLTRRLSAAAALRNAQVSMWQDKRWRNPRYWAAFTIQGEWK